MAADLGKFGETNKNPPSHVGGYSDNFMQNLVRSFIYSAGAILLFVATALFLVNFTTPADFAPAREPVFHLTVPLVFWTVGGVGLLVATVCLFGRNTSFNITLVSVFAASLLGCRVLVSVLDISDGFKGYLGGVADAFGLQGSTADALLIVTSLYLLAGCMVSHFLESKHS